MFIGTLLEKHEFLVLILMATWTLNALFSNFLDIHLSPHLCQGYLEIPSCCSGLWGPVTLALATPRAVPDPLGAPAWEVSQELLCESEACLEALMWGHMSRS